MIDLLARVLETPLTVKHALEPNAPLDAIVVLGAPLRRSGALSQILRERIVAAAALYHAGGASHVIATGRATHGAPRSRAGAVAGGVEARGGSRAVAQSPPGAKPENARFTAALLAERLPPGAVRTIWIVTQPFHGRRAARLFRDAGFEPRVWHIDDSLQYRERKRALRWLVREYAAWGKPVVVRKRGDHQGISRRSPRIVSVPNQVILPAPPTDSTFCVVCTSNGDQA